LISTEPGLRREFLPFSWRAALLSSVWIWMGAQTCFLFRQTRISLEWLYAQELSPPSSVLAWGVLRSGQLAYGFSPKAPTMHDVVQGGMKFVSHP
jgi:hypothetical protein